MNNPRHGNLPAHILRRIFLCLFLAILAGIFHLRTSGFPDWMVSMTMKQVDLGSYHWETDAIKFDILKGFILDNVRVYRKKVIGPAALDARQVTVSLNPLAFMSGGSVLREVRVSDGEIRPFLAAGPEEPTLTNAASEVNAAFHVVVDNCRILGVDVESMSSKVHAQESRVRFDDVRAALKNKNMRGDFSGIVEYDADTRLVDARIVTRLDPHILLPLIRECDLPFTAELVQRFNFRNSRPECKLRITRQCGSNSVISVDGRFRLQNGSYMDVDLLRADGIVHLNFSDTNSTVAVHPLLVVRNEGNATGGFTVDLDKSNVQFEAVSAVNPAALLRMAGVFTNDEMDVFHFNGPVKVSVKGAASYDDISGADFEGMIEANDMGIGSFNVDKCSFGMKMLGSTNTVSEIKATAYGGEVSGSAIFVAPEGTCTDTTYSIKGKIKDADFSKITNLMKAERADYNGKLTANLKLDGILGAGNGKTASGEGRIGIKDGRVFMLPVFGGLSHIMTKVIPGLDFVLRQSDASADFTIKNGVIHTDEARIEGDILSLTGRGDYNIAGKLDFDVQLKLLKPKTFFSKVVNFALYPISKLFEFRLRGTDDNPNWYPINFSKDILEELHLSDKSNSKP